MAAQRFADPTMPFHREVHNGCAIGTSIIVQFRAYQDQQKSLLLQLNSRTEIALNLVIPLNKPGQLSVNARINDQYTSEVAKPVHVPLNTPYTLHIRLDTHVSEIYLNNNHLLDFVHRVNPLEIKEVNIEGPLIISEVLFKPPGGASLEPLPSYDEASKSVVPEFQNLSITSTQNVPPYQGPERVPPSNISAVPPQIMSGPPPAGTVLPRGGQAVKPPYPEKEYPGGASALPPKKDGPPYPPTAQVAPQQPIAPPISVMPTQNRPSPYSQYPGQIPGQYPPATAPPQQYPSASAPPQQYPSAAAPPQQYPSAAAPPQQYPQPAPGGFIPQYPTQQPNVYPGPNPPPGGHQGYPGQYPGQPYPYPMYQQGYPQSYMSPTYPMYSYSYYDDCHHHHHHC